MEEIEQFICFIIIAQAIRRLTDISISSFDKMSLYKAHFKKGFERIDTDDLPIYFLSKWHNLVLNNLE